MKGEYRHAWGFQINNEIVKSWIIHLLRCLQYVHLFHGYTVCKSINTITRFCVSLIVQTGCILSMIVNIHNFLKQSFTAKNDRFLSCAFRPSAVWRLDMRHEPFLVGCVYSTVQYVCVLRTLCRSNVFQHQPTLLLGNQTQAMPRLNGCNIFLNHLLQNGKLWNSSV